MPSLASYSTSLNLLFFYMVCTQSKSARVDLTVYQTWSTLVLSQPPLKVEVVAILGIRLIFFMIPSLFFLALDSIVPSVSVSFKTQGTHALPTRTGGVRVSRKGAKSQWYNVVGLSLFNLCLGVAIQAGVEFLFTELLQFRSALRVTTTLPMPWSILKDVGRGLVLREVSSHASSIIVSLK